MESLPTEILQKTFILLRQEDQMECLLTCRFWKNIIEDTCLFQTLHVYSYSFLEKVWKKIKEKPALGKNVHHLTIHLFDSVGDDLSCFLEKLPNVRKFRAYGPSYKNLATVSSLKLSWYKYIEYIEEDTAQSMAPHLLSKNVCPNLTHLRLFSHDSNFIPLLKNAPALKSLFLEGIHINFDDIFNIHENSPNLDVFELKSPTIHRDGVRRGVIPTSSVTKLSLSYITSFSLDEDLGLLQLITRIYPNLVELVYETSYFPSSREEEIILYKDGWSPLLANLGPHLKKLYTNYMKGFQDFLIALDEHNCLIEDMKTYCLKNEPLPSLAHLQQISYIRALVLRNFAFNSFSWLKQLKVLETLECIVDRYQPPVRLDFNDLTNNCTSHLTSLTFHNLTIVAEIISATQYNIRDLSFICCSISEKIIRFIDRHFPLLTNLKLKNCCDPPKNIILRSAILESFCFIDTTRGMANNILVRTIYDGEERLYFVKYHKRYHPIHYYYREFYDSDFSPVKYQLVDETINIKPDTTLCCFRVNKVLVCR